MSKLSNGCIEIDINRLGNGNTYLGYLWSSKSMQDDECQLIFLPNTTHVTHNTSFTPLTDRRPLHVATIPQADCSCFLSFFLTYLLLVLVDSSFVLHMFIRSHNRTSWCRLENQWHVMKMKSWVWCEQCKQTIITIIDTIVIIVVVVATIAIVIVIIISVAKVIIIISIEISISFCV